MSGAAEPRDDLYDGDSDSGITIAMMNRHDLYTEDDWDMNMEEEPATRSFRRDDPFHSPSKFTHSGIWSHSMVDEDTANEDTAIGRIAKGRTMKEKIDVEITPGSGRKAQ
jgi:hypothetical protein